MTTKIQYNETPEFQKDFKKLSKHYKTLADDLEVAKRNAIELYHLKKIDNHSVFPIPRFCSEEIRVYKLKKFACKSLKGKGVRSGIRIIYAFAFKTNKVTFIEIYYKGDKPNEDVKRITNFLSTR